MFRSLFNLFIFTCLCGQGMGQEQILVPEDHPTIQVAIEAAVEGDTLSIAPGTYQENLDFLGKAIHVQSREGPSMTVIDGGRQGSVVSFRNGESRDAILEGFTLINGTGTVDSNHGRACGGGVFILEASPRLVCNIIVRNSCFPANGQGIGGVGGGIFCFGSALEISHCVIAWNRADTRGGGLASIRSKVRLVFCTVADNKAGFGGAIYSDSNGSLWLRDSIIWNNRGRGGDEIVLRLGMILDINFCHLKEGLDGLVVGLGCALNWGRFMFSEDPRFMNPKRRDYRLKPKSPCRETARATNDPDAPKLNRGPGDACLKKAPAPTKDPMEDRIPLKPLIEK